MSDEAPDHTELMVSPESIDAYLDANPPPQERPFVFTYRNYRGEVSDRRAILTSVRFGTSEWHPEPQWLLVAFDLDKQAEREFVLADISAPSVAAAAKLAEDPFCTDGPEAPAPITVAELREWISKRNGASWKATMVDVDEAIERMTREREKSDGCNVLRRLT
jgi:hypothetical protein